VLIDLDAKDPRPVYRQIVDEVRRCVSIGVLKPDEPLPAVRRLAADLKVNANTVQHAYRSSSRKGSRT
jgi:GntR family transcriptional regulator